MNSARPHLIEINLSEAVFCILDKHLPSLPEVFLTWTHPFQSELYLSPITQNLPNSSKHHRSEHGLNFIFKTAVLPTASCSEALILNTFWRKFGEKWWFYAGCAKSMWISQALLSLLGSRIVFSESIFVDLEMVSWSPGWPPILWGLERPWNSDPPALPPTCWDHRCACPHLVYVVLGIACCDFHLRGKHTTNCDSFTTHSFQPLISVCCFQKFVDLLSFLNYE